MTKKERFLTALQGGTPDMVPVAPLIHRRFADKLLGRSDWKAVFEVHQRIGSIYHRGPIEMKIKSQLGEEWGEEEHLLEQVNKKKVYQYIMRTPKGTLRAKDIWGLIPDDPLVWKREEYPVKRPEDWIVYESYWEQWLANAEELDSGEIEEACKFMGEEGVLGVGISSVFGRLGGARGMQDLLLDLYDQPSLLKDVMRTMLKVVEKEVEAFFASSSEVAWYDICWATGSNMSSAFFEKWILPDVQRVIELVRTKPGKYIGLYTLGRIKNFLPMLVEAGPHFIETFEQNEGDITLGEAKKKYGDRICLMGNFDTLIQVGGSIKEVKEETLRCLREGAGGGGYVLATADEVPVDAKVENLKAIVQTVEEYGRY